MEKVLLIDKEGYLFNLEPPDERLNSIKDTISQCNRLIRVSNSNWCFWSITSDFECKLYVYKTENYIQITEETYENQRKRSLLTLNEDYLSSNLLKNDPPSYSSESGDTYQPKEIFFLPTENWSWTTEWLVSEKNYQNQGWYYAFSFKSPFKKQESRLANVRRRKWIRKRIFMSHETYINIDLPITCEFANEISVGGNNLIKNGLSVWIVCSSGRLFFRKNVSLSNPEGTSWIEITIPNHQKAFSISCDQDGILWVITCDGSVLLRNEITEKEPFGKTWIFISDSNPVPFVQITSSFYQIYTLDSNGGVYKRSNTEENYTGKEWIKLLKDISNISVSRSGKLWAMSRNKKILYIGSKLDKVDSKLFEWKTLFLPFEFDFICANTSCDSIDDLKEIKC